MVQFQNRRLKDQAIGHKGCSLCALYVACSPPVPEVTIPRIHVLSFLILHDLNNPCTIGLCVHVSVLGTLLFGQPLLTGFLILIMWRSLLCKLVR